MRIFGKRSAMLNCNMCDVIYRPGDGRPHEYSHIAKISWTEPFWLPANLRAVGQGEYTFRCDRCNSFPTIKWPSDAGAYAGMSLHLATAHHAGMLAGSGSSSRGAVNFEMIRVS
jgi:hypothetical protein